MDITPESISLIANGFLIPAAVALAYKLLKATPQIADAYTEVARAQKKAKNVLTVIATVSSIVQEVKTDEQDNIIDPEEAARILSIVKSFVNSTEVKELIEDSNVGV